MQPAMNGQRVCRMHGGKSRGAQEKAERRRQESEAERILAAMIWNPAAEPITDHVGEMQRLAGSMRQAADVLGARLNPAESCPACGRGAELLDGVSGMAWTRVLRELRQLLVDMARLGLAERKAEFDAVLAQAVVSAYLDSLRSVSLLPVDRDRMLRVFLAGLGVDAASGGGMVAGVVEAP